MNSLYKKINIWCLLFLTLFCLCACTSSQDKILGSWRDRDEVWVFRSNGEMHHVRHFGNSYLQEKYKGTYSIDGKYLTMTVKSDMITVPFEFISEDKLQMQINGENSILNLVGNEYFYQEELRFESIGIPTGTMKYKVVFQYKNRPESTIELTAHNDEYAYISRWSKLV